MAAVNGQNGAQLLRERGGCRISYVAGVHVGPAGYPDVHRGGEREHVHEHNDVGAPAQGVKTRLAPVEPREEAALVERVAPGGGGHARRIRPRIETRGLGPPPGAAVCCPAVLDRAATRVMAASVSSPVEIASSRSPISPAMGPRLSSVRSRLRALSCADFGSAASADSSEGNGNLLAGASGLCADLSLPGQQQGLIHEPGKGVRFRVPRLCQP